MKTLTWIINAVYSFLVCEASNDKTPLSGNKSHH